MKKLDYSNFEEKYNSILQIQYQLADTTYMYGELARGSGKSTEILGSRVVRIAYAMPRSTIVFVGSTYVSLFENIIPAVIKYFNTHYVEGKHFVVGKQPPAHFVKPLSPVYKWNHTITTVWGTVIQLVSADRPESALGKSAAHILIDELLRIPEQVMVERIYPILRGDKEIHGLSHYFGGITGFSSTPNQENDHDWWLKYVADMDVDKIKEILYIAKKYNDALYYYHRSKVGDPAKAKAERFIKKWTPVLRELRRNQTFFLRASAFSNIRVLGLEYIERQFQSTKDFDKFKTSILSIRSEYVKEMFFAKFSKKHIFNDSYVYTEGFDSRDMLSIDINSRDLRYCDPNKKLLGGWDPGQAMSFVIAQKNATTKSKELRVIKNFFHISPDQQSEQAESFANFFKNHKRKELELYYDRAGNKREDLITPNGVIATDTAVKFFKRELEKRGWKVILMNLGQRTIYYSEHYYLLDHLFGTSTKTDNIQICQNQCSALISSIYKSPLKKSAGEIALDKTSEKKPLKEQEYESTQIATAFMYLLFGLYSSVLPSKNYSNIDYSPK